MAHDSIKISKPKGIKYLLFFQCVKMTKTKGITGNNIVNLLAASLTH
jgi:hypothetical protein